MGAVSAASGSGAAASAAQSSKQHRMSRTAVASTHPSVWWPNKSRASENACGKPAGDQTRSRPSLRSASRGLATLSARYDKLVAAGALRADPQQRALADSLENLRRQLLELQCLPQPCLAHSSDKACYDAHPLLIKHSKRRECTPLLSLTLKSPPRLF